MEIMPLLYGQLAVIILVITTLHLFNELHSTDKSMGSKWFLVLILSADFEITWLLLRFIPIRALCFCVLAVLLSFSGYFYRCTRKKRFLPGVFVAVALFAVYFIAEQSLYLLFSDDFNPVICQMIALTFYISAVTIALSRIRPSKDPIDRLSSVSLFICQFISDVVLYYLASVIPLVSERRYLFITIFSIVIVLLNLFLIFAIRWLAESEKIRQRQINLTNQLALQQQSYRQIESEYKSIRSYIHDINKHLRTVRYMMSENNYTGATDYIDHVLEEVNSSHRYISTGILVIDAIISTLMDRCDRDKISLRTQIEANSNIVAVDEYSYTIILGNIIDNAYNAVLTLSNSSERHIDVVIKPEGHKLVTIVQNSFDPQQISSIQKGIGLENIEVQIKRVGGIVEYRIMEPGVYRITAITPVLRLIR